MVVIYNLVKRNMINYFYDKTSIFFSMLSVFLLILVYVLFLGQLQVNTVIEQVGEIEGIDGLINSWLVAGLIITSTVTVPMATMSDIVIDRENKTFQDFYIAPISRSSIVFAYLISAVIIGVMMATLTFILGLLYVGFTSGIWISFISFMSLILVIILASTLFASFSFVILSFVKTTSAAGTINTLIGTVIGFFAGIYVPFGAFSSELLRQILEINPAAQIVTLLRSILMRPYLEIVFDGAPISILEEYREAYGVTTTFLGNSISNSTIGLFIIGWIIILILIGITRLKAYKEI
jgi:multidrug/hemolysin transport system permease protein